MHIGMLFSIMLELLPISIVFVIIILADIGLTNGVAYSTVFVMQMMYFISFTVCKWGNPIQMYQLHIWNIADLDFKYHACTFIARGLDVQLVMKYVSMANEMVYYWSTTA